MIKLLDLLENKILVPRRSPEERQKNLLIIAQKQIQQHIKDGSKGDLDLGNTPIKSLPQELKVGGDLNLYKTPIESLPQGLVVGGNLYLDLSQVQSLPLGLKVGGDLYLSPHIQSLPPDLKVGGDLYLSFTPMSNKYTEEEIRQMSPGISGRIYF
jgi:hypothetical protein